MVTVVGLDGCKGGWVAVVLENREFAGAAFVATAAEALTTWPDLAVLAIDIHRAKRESRQGRRPAGRP